MIRIYNGILLSHKRNTFKSVLMRWMNLEPIIQSEVNQKEKNFTKKGLNDPDNHDGMVT